MDYLNMPRSSASKIRVSAGSAAIVLSLLAMPTWAQTWVPNESQVSSQKDLLDPEYNQARAQFTWSDASGKLWVGNIDRDTGLFYPPDGKAVLIDADTMTADDVLITLNGPEWVFSADGDGIAYTKFNSTRHKDSAARLGYARVSADGTWSAGFLGPDTARKAPYGSETRGDPNPRITYVDQDKNHYWREIGNSATEQLLPGTPSSVGPVRHVRGARAVVYPSPVNGLSQVFYRNLDTGVVSQLTFDAGNKDQIFMWQAPEFNNEFVFMTLAENNEIRVYRNIPPAGSTTPKWTIIYSAIAPKKNSLASPEPFVFNNKSYVFMNMIVGNDGFASEIWISNISATAPMFRRVSDNTVLKARTDPEVFVTSTKVYIYYNRRSLVQQNRKLKPCAGVECSEGIFRSDAGIN